MNVLTTREPDAVVLDLGLGDMDGVDLCRTVREWSDVPIIILSAEDWSTGKVVLLDEGADYYVTKPFSMPELLGGVRAAFLGDRGATRSPRTRCSPAASSGWTSPATRPRSPERTWTSRPRSSPCSRRWPATRR